MKENKLVELSIDFSVDIINLVMGNLYFYIRKQDLKECSFDKAWLILQCG